MGDALFFKKIKISSGISLPFFVDNEGYLCQQYYDDEEEETEEEEN